jgi:hypothetical protein
MVIILSSDYLLARSLFTFFKFYFRLNYYLTLSILSFTFNTNFLLVGSELLNV